MIEKKLHSTSVEPERAIIVAIIRQGQTDAQTREYLDELAFLATTSNIETLAVYTQRLERPESRGYVGKGKLEEVQMAVESLGVDTVIFDDDLTPAQVRFLEDRLKVKILDRSLLILNIFSMRAQTAQSRTQVELAQYQYLYPRLTRLWSHLDKQRGGAGMRGPGEKELETDRRIVKERISLLKEKLAHIDRQSETRRKQRDQLSRVALVGYTNVGKSTLMNKLTQAEVLAENKLFATVDSTVRKSTLGDIPFLLTDTVGFIRKLPTHLIEAFKSTLDEVREADVLLHVVDVSSPNYQHQIEVVQGVLQDIGAADKPLMFVFNKIDQLHLGPLAPESGEVDAQQVLDIATEEGAQNLLEQLHIGPFIASPAANLPATASKAPIEKVFISAINGDGISELRQKLFEMIKPVHTAIYPNYLQKVVM